MERNRLGLALSGGGYRAAAFHLGTLRALNKLGILQKVDVISSVSGGAIIAAYYGLHQSEDFEYLSEKFKDCLRKSSLWESIANVLIVIAIPLILSFFYSSWFLLLYLLLLPFGFKLIPSSKWIALSYDRIFFNGKKLTDLPDSPIIGLNATNLYKGRLFTFSKFDVGGYDYKENGQSIIKGERIPISFAVSCSTCVPAFFSPQKINKKYFVEGKYKDNLLIDGGLYDNQGAYLLTESSNKLYRVDNIIVSDAGNSEPFHKRINNTLCLMNQSIEILMNRIRTMQIRKNIYSSRFELNDKETQFAYVSLRWRDLNNMPRRFIENLKSGHISQSILEFHKISIDEVKKLLNDGDNVAENEIEQKLKESIHWEELIKQIPDKKTYNLAYSVTTNLMPLSARQINALSSYAEWLTELQVKTYLPHLLKG